MEYHQRRPGLNVLQEKIDDFITEHEARVEQVFLDSGFKFLFIITKGIEICWFAGRGTTMPFSQKILVCVYLILANCLLS